MSDRETLTDDEIETTFTGASAQADPDDADGTDADGTGADGTDADGTDADDRDAADAPTDVDGTDR